MIKRIALLGLLSGLFCISETKSMQSNAKTDALTKYLSSVGDNAKIMIVGSGHKYDNRRKPEMGWLYFHVDQQPETNPDLVANISKAFDDFYSEKFDIVEFEFIGPDSSYPESIESALAVLKPKGKLIIYGGPGCFARMPPKDFLSNCVYDDLYRINESNVYVEKELYTKKNHAVFYVCPLEANNMCLSELLSKNKDLIQNFFREEILSGLPVSGIEILDVDSMKQYCYKNKCPDFPGIVITKK